MSAPTREKHPGLPRIDLSTLPLPKEDAACCLAKVDAHGRLPIGWCGPDCERKRRAQLIRGYKPQSQRRTPNVVASLDEHPRWGAGSSIWDDPTGDAAVQS